MFSQGGRPGARDASALLIASLLGLNFILTEKPIWMKDHLKDIFFLVSL